MEIIRSAGFNERRCIAREHMGLYGTVVTCATYSTLGLSVLSSGSLRSLLTSALKQCITEQPMLSTTILDAGTEAPKLAKVPAMAVTEHLSIFDMPAADTSSELAIRNLLHKAQNEQLELGKRPAWRLYAQALPIKSAAEPATFIAAFSYSHALADGPSGLFFHRALSDALEKCDGPTPDDGESFTVPSNIPPLAPALDRTVSFVISWSFLLRPLLNEFLPTWLATRLGVDTKDAAVWTGISVRPSLPDSGNLLPTELCFRQVSHSGLQRTVQTCRKHGARLTGLLTVVVARSLGQALRARGHDYGKLLVTLPINLRRCISDSQSVIANYPSAIEEIVTINSGLRAEERLVALGEEDWTTARHITESLGKASNTSQDHPIALLKYISNFREFVVHRATTPAEASFEISNIGVFDQAAGADTSSTAEQLKQFWTVTDVVFSQSANATGVPLNINVASVLKGPLSFTATWWPGMLGVEDEKRFVEEVLADVVDQLEQME
ncbi:hypothetical protein LTR62_004531 [Meristemomyces frigidus]|uniref:Alcohol acetyltransferase n=1 Tax=Meristemomyces frigidus TaxID=1508187 RepID=A0AAN7YP28_9PEZI|nr:hypothetical protein LTR62_004531 [Meristemomyces frigidus]